MKNIFKFMGVALLASSMIFVGCNKDEEDNNGGNNNNGNNGNTEVKYYTVTVATNSEDMGTVAISPVKEKYAAGDTVVLTATAKEDFMFVKWNDDNTDNPRTIVVTKNANYMANFAESNEPSIKIYWGGELQELGLIDAYYWNNGMFYEIDAARGLQGNDIVFPYFVISYLNNQGTIDLAAFYTFTTTSGQQVSGYDEIPTYVYDSIAIDGRGDYELGSSNDLTNIVFDANSHTLTCSMTQDMYNNYDYLTYIANLGLGEGVDPTDEQMMAAYQASRWKELTVEVKNYVFEAYSGRKSKINIKK